MSKFLRSLVRSHDKSCKHKVKYNTRESALRSAEKMMEKKGNGEVFEAYQCDFCMAPKGSTNAFHIGHQTNLTWIPPTHIGQYLMINKYLCECQIEFYTSTVFGNRILTHFPCVIDAAEQFARCPGKHTMPHLWQGRRWVNLESVPLDSTATLKDLWPDATLTPKFLFTPWMPPGPPATPKSDVSLSGSPQLTTEPMVLY